MRKLLFLLATLLLVSCEKMLIEDTNSEEGNVILKFSPYTQSTFTRAASSPEDCFSKMALMIFDANKEKAFDKVKTQTSDDENFGTFKLTLPEGTYYIVSVGHNSPVTPTIKSTEAVQFTAKNGRKLFDTFNYYGTIVVGEEETQYDLTMNRVVAMFRLTITDEIPAVITQFKFDYTGGSANYNPSTGEGYTTSTQSELRTIDEPLEVYTFPLKVTVPALDTKHLKITVSALDVDGNIICKKNFVNVPIAVNKITEYKGAFFDGVAEVGSSGVGFTVNSNWTGTNTYEF